MLPLLLHGFHADRGASFSVVGGSEVVAHYRPAEREYASLTQYAALVDLSFRGRICLLGADREKFLHGQVTNDVAGLKPGQGCYAALVTAKAKMESDLFIFKLADEVLLDFEPGLTSRVSDRLNRYIIAEDVQVVDVSPHYGLLSVQGPAARQILEQSSIALGVPDRELGWVRTASTDGDIYVARNARYGLPAYDVFAPNPQLQALAEALEAAVRRSHPGVENAWAGFDALEIVRIENGVPRFGVDMTETTIPQEAELQQKAISFSKGCYIGQEIIARIRTYGQVAKALRLLRLPPGTVPPPGTAVTVDGKNVGTITSGAHSPKFGGVVALGYIRKEHFAPGSRVQVGETSLEAEIVAPAGGA